MKNNYILAAPNFRAGMDKRKSGKWAKLILPSQDEIFFSELDDEIVLSLNPGEEVKYQKGWNDRVDSTQIFIAEPLSNRYYKFQ